MKPHSTSGLCYICIRVRVSTCIACLFSREGEQPRSASDYWRRLSSESWWMAVLFMDHFTLSHSFLSCWRGSCRNFASQGGSGSSSQIVNILCNISVLTGWILVMRGGESCIVLLYCFISKNEWAPHGLNRYDILQIYFK